MGCSFPLLWMLLGMLRSNQTVSNRDVTSEPDRSVMQPYRLSVQNGHGLICWLRFQPFSAVTILSESSIVRSVSVPCPVDSESVMMRSFFQIVQKGIEQFRLASEHAERTKQNQRRKLQNRTEKIFSGRAQKGTILPICIKYFYTSYYAICRFYEFGRLDLCILYKMDASCINSE